MCLNKFLYAMNAVLGRFLICDMTDKKETQGYKEECNAVISYLSTL